MLNITALTIRDASAYRYVSSVSGLFDDPQNWTNGLVPDDALPTFITPDNGLIVTGPAAPTALHTLSLGTPGSGFAELRLQASGDLAVANGTTVSAGGRLGGSGQIGGGVMVESGGEIVALTGDALTFDSPVNNGGEVIAVNATLTFPGDGNPGVGGNPNDGLTNNGTLNLINATIHGDIHSPSGSTINVAAGVVFNGLVSGGGSFPGAGLVTFNGGYSPGDSPAVVALGGGIAFGSTSTLTIELGGLLAGQSDQLLITGDATLAGALDIQLLPGLLAPAGTEFDLIVARSVLGQFVKIIVPVNDQQEPLLALEVVERDGRQTLRATALMELARPESRRRRCRGRNSRTKEESSSSASTGASDPRTRIRHSALWHGGGGKH